ncbi:MAG TPA: hypothetical protein VMV10_30980 [Pirellulales bacterium]|nr:hypothetical protein [Pirellulales bacterium]
MQCKRHRLLFLKATNSYDANITAHIEGVCRLLGVEFQHYEYTSLDAFEEWLENNRSFDLIYIAAHGAHHCFGEQVGPIARWADFAYVLCRTAALNPNSVLFMGCCHGGLKKVSLILFSLCEQVSSICGPRWTVNLSEVPVALHVFLHNLITNTVEPEVAAERTASALGIHFPYYNRYELEAEVLLIKHLAVEREPDYVISPEVRAKDFSACCSGPMAPVNAQTSTTGTTPNPAAS